MVAVPFVASGVCVCIALTKFPREVSGLYAADLLGAGAGCIALIALLEVTDGPTAVLVVAWIAGLAGLLFAREARAAKPTAFAATVCVVLTALTVANGVLAGAGQPPLRLRWVKGRPEAPALYEKWNSFSRIRVFGDPSRIATPAETGWSLSSKTHRIIRFGSSSSTSTERRSR